MNQLRQGTPEEAGLDPARLDLLRQRAEEWIASGKHQNLVLLLARRGVICLHEAWGKLTPASDSPAVEKDSVFWVASNSKPVTATAIMMLVEDGALSLNRHVVEYIPELTGDGAQDITVFNLLTHTSGFDFMGEREEINARLEEDFPVPATGPGEHEEHKRDLHAGFALKPSIEPGSAMSYSNYNYALLGEIVRRVSGLSFWDFTRERIFDPLGMVDSSFRFDPRWERRTARLDPAYPFLEDFEINDEVERYLWDNPHGGQGLLTTAADYARFVQMIINGGSYGNARLLNPRTVRLMTTNQIPGIGTDFFGDWHDEGSWGLGFRVLSADRWPWFDGSITQPGTIMHGGAGGTEWWADPGEELLGVYLSVCLDHDYTRVETRMNFDLVQNLVTAAIVD